MTKNSKSVKVTVLLVSSLTIMSMITISPSLPRMSEEFSQVPNAEFLVKLVMTLPALFIAFFSPIAGILIDKYGRLGLLYIALLLYAISGTSAYFIDNLYTLLASRAVFGLAVGTSMTIVNTLVADYFDGQQRQKFVGLQVAFMSLGGILFVGLGGVLADINWRYPFLIYLFALVVLPFALRFLYEPDRSSIQQSDDSSQKSPPIIWLLFVNMMIMWILFFLIPVQLPFHLKALGVESNALLGLAIGLSTLFSAISSIAYVKLKGKFDFNIIFFIGYLILGASFYLIAVAQGYTTILFAMVLAGLGMGMMIPNTNIWVMSIAPQKIRGREIGRLTTFWFFGQFASPLLLLPVAQKLSIAGTFYLGAGTLVLLSIFFLIFHFVYSKSKNTTTSTSHVQPNP